MPVFLKKAVPQPFVVAKVPLPPEPKPAPVVVPQRRPEHPAKKWGQALETIKDREVLKKRVAERRVELAKAEVYPLGEIGAFFKWLDQRELVICAWNAIGYSPYRGTKRLIQEYQGKIGPLDSDDWHGFGGEELTPDD